MVDLKKKKQNISTLFFSYMMMPIWSVSCQGKPRVPEIHFDNHWCKQQHCLCMLCYRSNMETFIFPDTSLSKWSRLWPFLPGFLIWWRWWRWRWLPSSLLEGVLCFKGGLMIRGVGGLTKVMAPFLWTLKSAKGIKREKKSKNKKKNMNAVISILFHE